MNDVEIRLSAPRIVAGELRVPYELVNHGASAVFVYNLVPDRDGQLAGKPDLAPTARLAQTCYDSDHLVMFVLAEVKPPREFPEPAYYAPAVPRASRIDAGAAFQATIRAQLPLVEWCESWSPQRDDPALVPTAVHTIQIIADWVRASDVTAQLEDPEYPGCHGISDRMRHRVIAEADVRELGITIGVHPSAPRFP